MAAYSAVWRPGVDPSQGGVFSRRQAEAAGLTRAQVQWRIRRGVWRHVAGDAYCVAGERVDEVLVSRAAVLTWPDAVVALGTAARLHRLPVSDDGLVHVVVPDGRHPRRRLRPHRLALSTGDVTRVLGIPVTTRRRTAIDCLGRLPGPESSSLLAYVQSRRILAPDELQSWLAANPSRWGNQARREAAARLRTGAVNPAEDRLHDILRAAGIEGWVGGASLLAAVGVPAVADVYFPDVRLVIEIDGRAAHSGERFWADRRRQNSLVAAGCTVLRYTWRDLVDRSDHVAAEVARMLARLRA